MQEQNARKKWHAGRTHCYRLRKDNVPFMTWPVGRIVAIHPGKDGDYDKDIPWNFQTPHKENRTTTHRTTNYHKMHGTQQ